MRVSVSIYRAPLVCKSLWATFHRKFPQGRSFLVQPGPQFFLWSHPWDKFPGHPVTASPCPVDQPGTDQSTHISCSLRRRDGKAIGTTTKKKGADFLWGWGLAIPEQIEKGHQRHRQCPVALASFPPACGLDLWLLFICVSSCCTESWRNRPGFWARPTKSWFWALPFSGYAILGKMLSPSEPLALPMCQRG